MGKGSKGAAQPAKPTLTEPQTQLANALNSYIATRAEYERIIANVISGLEYTIDQIRREQDRLADRPTRRGQTILNAIGNMQGNLRLDLVLSYAATVERTGAVIRVLRPMVEPDEVVLPPLLAVYDKLCARYGDGAGEE